MANWCVNNVSFTGDLADILKAVQLFKKMTYDEETNREPLTPDFIGEGQASMFDFGVIGKGIYFRTPWSPAIETVRAVAEHFNLDYVHRYEEYGMKLCGEATRRADVFDHIKVDYGDLRAISYNAGEDQFTFEGRLFEDDWAVIVEILDRKLAIRDASGEKQSVQIAVQNEQPQLTQQELIAWRLAGKLPHIDINGTDFTIDVRLHELRETAAPWNRLEYAEQESSPGHDDYLFFYDTQKHQIWQLPDDLTVLPENVVMVSLPNELILDPVAAARSVGYEETKFLEEYPIQADLKATVIPLAETFLPRFIEENLQNQNDTRGYKR